MEDRATAAMSRQRKDKILPIEVRAYNHGIHYDYGSMPVKKMKVDPGPSDVAGHLTLDPCPDPSDVRDDHLDSSQFDPEVGILTML